MTSSTPAFAVFGAAAVVSAAGAGVESTEVRYGAEIVAMLALSAVAVLTGRHRALRLFGLLLAGSALAELAATWLSYPDPIPRGPGGCPIVNEAVTDYWTGQLRLGQLATVLRFGALICVTLAVSELPRRPALRGWHRPVLVTLVSVPALLIGLYPLYSDEEPAELLHPTLPATLMLAVAIALTVLTVTRDAGGWARAAALLSGGVLALVPALSAVGEAATPVTQLRYLAPALDPRAFVICAYAYGTTATTPSTVALTAGGVLLTLAAPALLLWASPQPPRSDF